MQFLSKVKYKMLNLISLKTQHVQFKGYPDIRGRLHIRNLGEISMGKGVKINSGLFPNPVGGGSETIISIDPGAKLSIGMDVGISNAEIVVKREITIEDGVMIGGGVKIYDSDFHPIDPFMRKEKPNNGTCLPVEIHEGAFIGAHSIILKGVTIGKYSVIGAGSVVTKDIPSYEVWAGNPAKFIKKLNTQMR